MLSSPVNRSIFSATCKFSYIQRSLASIYNAKPHVYSNTFFGLKKFYGDEFDFKSSLHPNDRRKIRFGLKSNVDFIIQLDFHILMDLLTKPDQTIQRFTTWLDFPENTHFPDDSHFGLLKLANPTECRRLHLILKRVISNMHFSQSMSGFLASESAIEAAKIVVTEAVKRGPDLGSFLRGGSFASCVQVYRNLSSQFDYDSAFSFSAKSRVSRTAWPITPNIISYS